MTLSRTVGWVVLCGSLGCGPKGAPDAGGAGGGGGGAGGGGGSGGCDGATKTPPNLVPNHGFECGDRGWAPQLGTLETVTDARTGANAARLTATDAGEGVFAYSTPIVSNAPSDHYCATAWVKGTVGNMKLSIKTNKNGAGVDTTFSSPVATTSWIRVPPFTVLAVPNTFGMDLYVRFLLSQGNAGDTLLVDDVDVWESVDGGCNQAR